jgi:hypothetical protein
MERIWELRIAPHSLPFLLLVSPTKLQLLRMAYKLTKPLAG